MKSFYSRSLVAVAFVIVMIAGILWNHLSFYLLFLLIGALGMWEFFRLAGQIFLGFKESSILRCILALLLLPFSYLAASGNAFFIASYPASFIGFQGLIFTSILILILSPFRTNTLSALKNTGLLFLGYVYIGLPFSLLVWLKWQFYPADFPIVPLSIIVFIWVNDTMAYIVGSLIGKTPLAPVISPKKTIEGTLGGILLTLVAAWIWSLLFAYFPVWLWVMMAGLTAAAGTLGDLLESVLKRKAGVKDSGTLLASHGGILDRFDSLLLAVPAVWLLLFVYVQMS